MTNRRLEPASDDDRRILSVCLEESVPVRRAALALGVSAAAVRACLARHGVRPPVRDYPDAAALAAAHGPVPVADRRIVYLYLDCGFTMRAVAAAQDCTYATVNNRLLEWGVRARPRGQSHQNLPSREFALTRWMYQDVGMTMLEISEALGRDRNAVRWRLVSAGVTLRPRSVPVVSRRTPAQQRTVQEVIAAVCAGRAPAAA